MQGRCRRGIGKVQARRRAPVDPEREDELRERLEQCGLGARAHREGERAW